MSTATTAPPPLMTGEYRVAKNAEGRWRVTDPNGDDPFPDREFEEGVNAFGALVAGSVGKFFAQSTSTADDDVIVITLLDRQAEVTISATVTLEMEAFLEGFARKTGGDFDGAVKAAIRLLKIANDAIREGKKIAILDDSEDSEQEIVGIMDKSHGR